MNAKTKKDWKAAVSAYERSMQHWRAAQAALQAGDANTAANQLNAADAAYRTWARKEGLL